MIYWITNLLANCPWPRRYFNLFQSVSQVSHPRFIWRKKLRVDLEICFNVIIFVKNIFKQITKAQGKLISYFLFFLIYRFIDISHRKISFQLVVRFISINVMAIGHEKIFFFKWWLKNGKKNSYLDYTDEKTLSFHLWLF